MVNPRRGPGRIINNTHGSCHHHLLPLTFLRPARLPRSLSGFSPSRAFPVSLHTHLHLPFLFLGCAAFTSALFPPPIPSSPVHLPSLPVSSLRHVFGGSFAAGEPTRNKSRPLLSRHTQEQLSPLGWRDLHCSISGVTRKAVGHLPCYISAGLNLKVPVGLTALF